MKKIFTMIMTITLCAALVFTLGACTDNGTSSDIVKVTTTRPFFRFEVTPCDEEGVLMIRTSLYVGTIINVTIGNGDLGIIKSDETTVLEDARGAYIKVGPFDNDGEPLPDANYLIYLTTHIASEQPKAVRAAIGEKGEKLEGRNVMLKDGERFVRDNTAATVKDGMILPKE